MYLAADMSSRKTILAEETAEVTSDFSIVYSQIIGGIAKLYTCFFLFFVILTRLFVAPNEKMVDVLKKTMKEAKDIISKVNV